MTAPRLEIDLEKIHHNASTLVKRLKDRGISVTGVTKATLGSPEIAGVLLQAGVGVIGGSRIENIEALRGAGWTHGNVFMVGLGDLRKAISSTPCVRRFTAGISC